MATHTVIDLETLGIQDDAIVLSIGMATTDGQVFEWFLDVDEQVNSVAEPGTVLWWLKQGGDARASQTEANRVPVSNALRQLKPWFDRETLIWGNSPEFDLGKLRYLDKHYGDGNLFDNVPYWSIMDFRTALAVTGAERILPTVPHSAAHDASAELQTIEALWRGK